MVVGTSVQAFLVVAVTVVGSLMVLVVIVVVTGVAVAGHTIWLMALVFKPFWLLLSRLLVLSWCWLLLLLSLALLLFITPFGCWHQSASLLGC